jgi:hypothetical protein
MPRSDRTSYALFADRQALWPLLVFGAFGVNFLSRWADTRVVADATVLTAIIPLSLIAYLTWLTDKDALVIQCVMTMILLFVKRDGRVRLRAIFLFRTHSNVSNRVSLGRLGKDPRMRRAWRDLVVSR